jgi:hypothetical protein
MIHARARIEPAQRRPPDVEALAGALALQMLKSVSGAS